MPLTALCGLFSMRTLGYPNTWPRGRRLVYDWAGGGCEDPGGNIPNRAPAHRAPGLTERKERLSFKLEPYVGGDLLKSQAPAVRIVVGVALGVLGFKLFGSRFVAGGLKLEHQGGKV